MKINILFYISLGIFLVSIVIIVILNNKNFEKSKQDDFRRTLEDMKQILDTNKILEEKFLEPKLTIGIKTFCRPKSLNESLNSIVKYNKYKFKIIIADDSNDEYKLKNKEIIKKYEKDKEIELLDLKFDSGLSKGRNEIVKNCNTKYLMILDDSRYFDNNLKIKEIINFLEENEYDLFFGGIKNRISDGTEDYTCLFVKFNENEIKCKSKKKINNKIFSNLYETNLGLNVFIAETNSLKKTLWRDELKLGEHEIFFQDYYKKGFKCVYSPDVQFIQVSAENKKYDKEFIKYRNRFTTKDMIKINF